MPLLKAGENTITRREHLGSLSVNGSAYHISIFYIVLYLYVLVVSYNRLGIKTNRTCFYAEIVMDITTRSVACSDFRTNPFSLAATTIADIVRPSQRNA